jgi:flagellar hook assembly protein FlgD
MRQPTALRVAPRPLLSPLALSAALIAALILSFLPNAVAQAGSPTKSAHATPSAVTHVTKHSGTKARPRGATAPGKAVIIVGPVESLSSMYLAYAEQWAQRAEAQGMDVRRVFTPNATWANVLDNIQGAKLVVYLGHGNGWPSPYSPFQEDTKDGFGLNSSAAGTHYNVKYYGANFIRSSVHLGANAIVVLGHACYSAGNGEANSPIPDISIAKQRPDNFAAGFLTAGAAVYFAYSFQQDRDMVKDLFTLHKSMDELFMIPNSTTTYGGYRGINDPYFTPVRTPGARMHMDYIPNYGWQRAVVGNLDMTTDDWLGLPTDPDTTPPDMTRFKPVTSSYTYDATAPAEGSDAVFTPNGDGTSDSINVATTTSEASYVDVVVKDVADNSTVRRFTSWVPAGAGTINWNGKTATGGSLPDGTYRLTATPKDRSGNVGTSAVAEVKLLTSLRTATASPGLFYARDNDNLAPTTTLGVTLVRNAVVSWILVDTAGNVVATKLQDADTAAGALSWTWAGKNDDGTPVRDGLYWSIVTATTSAGSYVHRFGVYQSAFKLWSAVSSANGGTTVSFTVTSAEPLSKYPTVTITQPGVTPWRVLTSRIDSMRYKATITFKTGHPGAAALRVWGYDTADMGQGSDFTFTVR